MSTPAAKPRTDGDAPSPSWACGLISGRDGERLPLNTVSLPQSGLPWLVDYDLNEERGEWLRARLGRRAWSLWRYRELLPVARPAEAVDLGEGGTPLVRLRRLVPGGLQAWLKDESGNPTGSFKARGLSVAVNRARELGAPGVQLPSAGNAALAAAAYAAAAGLPCRLALPRGTPKRITRSCRLLGAEVLHGGRTLVEAAGRLSASDRGFWDLATFREPYRVEGKKSMGFEIAEQFDWRLPDWIVYPTGGGTGIVAMSKAFDELRRLGLVRDAGCRFAAVQMEGCAPLARAYRQGASRAAPWTRPRTRVWGLRVPRSLADFLILRAIRKSDGVVIAVPEPEVPAMQRRAAEREGLMVGPEGAAALVGLTRLLAAGRIRPDQRVVVLQTGHPANYR